MDVTHLTWIVAVVGLVLMALLGRSSAASHDEATRDQSVFCGSGARVGHCTDNAAGA
jgi:hypothetical protein